MSQPINNLMGTTVLPPLFSGNLNGTILNNASSSLPSIAQLTQGISAITPAVSGAATPTSSSLLSAVPNAFTSAGSSSLSSLFSSIPTSATASPTLGMSSAGLAPASGIPTPSLNSLLQSMSGLSLGTSSNMGMSADMSSTLSAMSNQTASVTKVNAMLVNVLQTVAMMATQKAAADQAQAQAEAAAQAQAAAAAQQAAATAAPVAADPTQATTMAAPTANMAATTPDQTSAALDRLIVGGTAQQKAQLKQNLLAIGNDPEGGKLLQESIRRGVTFSAGNPAAILGSADQGSVVDCPACAAAAAAAADGNNVAADGKVIVRGVTTTNGQGQSQITVADPNNLKTLVHEMVHATSTGDGNSQLEEGIANVIGRRVEARVSGIALEDPNFTFNQTFLNGNYSELARNNNIKQSLANLGIQAPNLTR